MRLLLVEDDKGIAENLKIILERHGFAVVVAPDTQSARGKAIDEQYDLFVLDWMLPDGSGIMLAQGLRLNILLNNLLSNTFKYGKSGGKIHVLVTRENSVVSITISDDGPGMDADESRQMFHRFFRGRNQSRISGSGLGLSLVEEIIHSHQLKLDVKSSLTDGTTITISGFPMSIKNAD